MIEVGENQNLNHYSGKNRAANHATIAKKTNVSAVGNSCGYISLFSDQ